MSMIHVNGEPHHLVPSLALLLEELGLGNAAVATALNGYFVPANERHDALLKGGDQIEVLSPMQGG